MKDRLYFLSDGQPRIDFEVEEEAGRIVVTALLYPAANQGIAACDTTEEAAAVMADPLLSSSSSSPTSRATSTGTMRG